MKCLKRMTAVMLLLSLVFVICACTPPQKVIDEVYKYLDEKYPEAEFEMGTVTQDTATSGRYIISVHCKTTDIDFDIYASTLIVTDGYGAKYANRMILDQVTEALGGDLAVLGITAFQWIDIYEEGFAGYRFREMSSTEAYDFRNVSEIYRISLKDMVSASEAALVMKDILVRLHAKGANYDQVTFEFVLEGDKILFATDTKSVLETEASVLEERILCAEAESKTTNILFTQHDDPKTVAFFIGTEAVTQETLPEETTDE